MGSASGEQDPSLNCTWLVVSVRVRQSLLHLALWTARSPVGLPVVAWMGSHRLVLVGRLVLGAMTCGAVL